MAPRTGCVYPSLDDGLRRQGVGTGVGEAGASVSAPMKALQRGVKGLRRANGTGKRARAFFAQAGFGRRLES